MLCSTHSLKVYAETPEGLQQKQDPKDALLCSAW